MGYLKIFFRNIFKQKGYSLINILGLAVGIAVCSMIFLWVYDEISYDKYHENLDNIYEVLLNVEGQWWNSCNWALAPILKRDYPEVEKASRYAVRRVLLKNQKNSFYESAALVDEDFLDIFTYPFIEGDPRTALSSINSIVLTESAAKKFFGSEDPMNKSLALNNAMDFMVTGLIKDVPSNSTLQFDVIASVKLFGDEKLNSWATESNSYLLLKDNISVPDFIDKISGLVMKYDTRTNRKVEASLRPFKGIHLYSLNGTDPILYVYLFSAIALFILIIACINFINLTTARAGKRAKEIGMRKVVGATRRNLIVQLFSESMIMSFIALLVAVLLIEIFLPAFNSLSGKQLRLDLAGNPLYAAGLLIITLAAGLLSGIYPALVLSSFRPAVVLKSSAGSGSYRSIFRKVLVVGQFAATIIIIIGSLVLYKQLNYIKSKDLGFNRDQIVIIPLNVSLKENLDSFKNELKNYPGIINATWATNIPTSVGNTNPVYWEGRTADNYKSANWVAVDYDYFDTFEMSFVEGRGFSKEHSTDLKDYVINEEMARLMGFDTTIGKMFSIWDNEGKVIGVVKNFHARSLHDAIGPVVFTMDPKWDWSLANVFVKIKPEDIPATIDYIKNAAAKFAPDYPFDYSFLDDYFDRQYRGDRQIGRIFEYSSMVAIFIACLGLFGLTTYMVRQRTKEIGIRKILGASKSYIITLLLREFLLLILLANLIAWPIAYQVVKKLMSSYAYRADITVWLYCAAAAFTLILAFATIGFQTIKAARSNPVDSLRYE